VFALQTCDDPDEYDPLRIDQWEFRVMPHRALLATGQTSARLPFFDNHGIKPVNYDGVADAVNRARLENDQLASDA
jgi:hypothetical protein